MPSGQLKLRHLVGVASTLPRQSHPPAPHVLEIYTYTSNVIFSEYRQFLFYNVQYCQLIDLLPIFKSDLLASESYFPTLDLLLVIMELEPHSTAGDGEQKASANLNGYYLS
jgi:hypothetical protein